MAAVVVTGGTGRLGRILVPMLLARGHQVSVLSRRAEPIVPPGALARRGDVRTGDGVAAATDGAEVVIHAASSPRRHARETEEAGARSVSAAARRAGAHLVYVSIVGVDRHRFPYYRAKFAAERIIGASGADWTVLRATQFHDLIDQMLRGGVFIRTRHLRFQPVDAGDVATRLVELAGGAAQGLVPDFGGPEVLDVRELAESRREITGRRTRLVLVPALGASLADYEAGHHLAPDHRSGARTWRQWLADGESSPDR